MKKWEDLSPEERTEIEMGFARACVDFATTLALCMSNASPDDITASAKVAKLSCDRVYKITKARTGYTEGEG